MIYTFFEVATVMFACLLIHIFFNSWYGTRNRAPFKNFLIMTAYFLLHSIAVLLPIDPMFRTLISAFLVTGVAVVLYDTSKPSAIYSALLFLALAVLSEYLSLVVLQMLGVDSYTLMSDGNIRAIYLALAKIVHLIIVLIAASVLRRNRAILTIKQIAPLLPCVLVSIYVCIVFFRIYSYLEEGYALMLIIALIGLLYVNGIIIFNTQAIKSSIVEFEEHKLANKHYEMQKQYYHNVIVDREETRALWHDLKKHVTALEVLVNSGGNQHAKNEYESINKAFNELGNVVDTENTNINAIVHHNISRAKSNGVRVTLDAHVSPDLSISAVDLSVIIGNTFDNAIEECLLLENTERIITVTILQKNNMLFYEISNPCLPVSHKKPGKIRGYGLKNVQRCAEKHSGSMEYGVFDGKFKVSIRLTCQN